MRGLHRDLRAFFERHPKLDLVDRALGTPLHAFLVAGGLIIILAIPGVAPKAFLVVCFVLVLVVEWATGWRDVGVDLYRMKRRSGPEGS